MQMLSVSERMAKQREAKAALAAEREAKRIERQHKNKYQARQKSYSGNSMILGEINMQRDTWAHPKVDERLSADEMLTVELHYQLHLYNFWKHNDAWSRFHLDLLIEANHYLSMLYDEPDLKVLCNNAFDELQTLQDHKTPNARKANMKYLIELVQWYTADLAITPKHIIKAAVAHADCYLSAVYARTAMNFPEFNYFGDMLTGSSITTISKQSKRPEAVTKSCLIGVAVWLSRVYSHERQHILVFENDGLTKLRQYKVLLIQWWQHLYNTAMQCERAVLESCIRYGWESPIANPLKALKWKH